MFRITPLPCTHHAAEHHSRYCAGKGPPAATEEQNERDHNGKDES